ncbi:MAG: NAD(P)H-hydrate dehydratase [Actinobacteria bacterium]|nr:NAD(P)H-hydrate dehydratase [Actinomycetota bacterium]MCG2808050.1 NAD(P)H-hydrate dehydratase [Coriobacteriia bacterium]
MRYAVTQQGARDAEERAVAELGISLFDLMARAGARLAHELESRVPFGPIAVLVGTGNNGGDGWIAAAELHAHDRDVVVFTPVPAQEVDGIASQAAQAASAAGVKIRVVDGILESDSLSGYAAVIDALFGIGLTGPIRQPFVTWVEAMNASGAFVASADMPSGVQADSGRTDGHVVRADLTVTFSAAKQGLLLYPGAARAGEVVIADIGIPWEMNGLAGGLELWDPSDYAALLPRHPRDVHKNTRGRVLIVGGSGGFPGSMILAAMGAQRMGAGYVTLAVPESIAAIIQARLASVVVLGMPENPSRTLASRVTEEIIDVARESDAVVVGPGMTMAHGAVLVARKLVSDLTAPLLLDADGLNAMIDSRQMLLDRTGPTVLTPHPGELARLLETTSAEVQADRLSYGAKLTGARLACVLKGAHTIVSGRGRQVLTTSGGPALATAGTGDVLAGMVGALLAQGLEPLEAGALGAYLHGRAGDHAAAELTERCVIAEDVPGYLPRATSELIGYSETVPEDARSGSVQQEGI